VRSSRNLLVLLATKVDRTLFGETVEFIEYGDRQGRTVIYFHGAPGAAEEAALFSEVAQRHSINIVCWQRFSIDQSLTGEDYFQHMADEIQTQFHDRSLDIIGFSIGAYAALEVASRLGDQVGQVHLISAAGPISSKEILDAMAGGMVFKLAKNQPMLFSWLTGFQRLIAVLAPKFLFKMLFASAQGSDRELAQSVDFQHVIRPLLTSCFSNYAKGYQRDIDQYVQWSGSLKTAIIGVSLWHGTEDNWSPFAMATELHQLVEASQPVNSMVGLSHYSCLYQAIPKICAVLESSE